MHLAVHSPEVVKHQVRPIFAETVGEDLVGRLTATQIYDRLTHGLHIPNGLHSRSRARYARHASSVAKFVSNSADSAGYSSASPHITYWGHLSKRRYSAQEFIMR